ncbi:MAG TPA: hypothetical protein PLV72_03975 [Candidatus Magasanikbacteria bacterium]|nr:hypothetical protein [Candidatus Magasanikbacteria bacterium]
MNNPSEQKGEMMEKTADVMEMIKGRVSVGSYFDRNDALKILEVWDMLDADVKQLLASFDHIAGELLMRKLNITKK